MSAAGALLATLLPSLALAACAARGPVPTRAPAPAVPASPRWPVTIAHRGAAGLFPEETLFAMRAARDRFAPLVLDADVRATSDGALVLLHDATVDRTTDGTGAIDTITLAQARALDAAYCFSPEIDPAVASAATCRAPPAGATFPYRAHAPRIALATVDELFAEFPAEQPIHLELKVEDARAARALAALIVGAHRVATTCVGAFSDRTTAWLREALPAGCVYAPESVYRCQARALAAGAASFDGCDPAVVLEPPLRLDDAPLVTRRYIALAHASGARVRTWTVNDADAMRALIAAGVDGIFTDRPDRLAAVLAER